jgi:predicted nucleic acid-binding protein
VIVIDANVAVKWYVPERGTEAALELLTGPELIYAPELIRLEVLAAITRRVRNGESTAEEARSRCDAWFRHLRAGTVSLPPEADIISDAIDFSLAVRHSLQDCMYLATARRLAAPLVTADRPFLERAVATYRPMSLLAGCESN